MSTISSVGGYSSMMMQGMGGGMRRPDSSKMVDDLFSKLDTSNQGYLTKSDLQSALDSASSSSSSNSTSSSSSTSSSGASVDDIFSALDSNGDGKITKDEMKSGLDSLASQLDSQFNNMRMNGGMDGTGGMNGMPPPPPPSNGSGDANAPSYTKDQLTSMASELSSTDSTRASLMSKLASNFDAADSNGDGKISASEAMAYDQSTQTSSTTSSTTASNSSSSSDSSSSSSSTDLNAKILKQIMDLMAMYGGQNANQSQNFSSLLSLTA